MKHYTEDHEWVEIENGIATVGITAHAAQELGDITFVDLPAKGTEVSQGDTLTVVESVKAASDVYAPVSGRVSAINKSLTDQPELLNESPEEDGWICRLSGVDETELENLLTEKEYLELVANIEKS